MYIFEKLKFFEGKVLLCLTFTKILKRLCMYLYLTPSSFKHLSFQTESGNFCLYIRGHLCSEQSHCPKVNSYCAWPKL